MYSLTAVQAQLLAFIKEEIASKGLAPSVDEMRGHMRFGSKSGVHRILLALEERGHIMRLKHRARAIKILEEK